MHVCIGCNREFEKANSLNTHKRFCEQWTKLGLQKSSSRISMKERKKIPVTCSHCSKEFKNIFSCKSHEGYCSGSRSVHANFLEKRGWAKGQTANTNPGISERADKRRTPLDEILLGQHPEYQTFKLKKRLLAEGILKNECCICGISSWMNKSIECELDHVNGNRHDHRIENLRMLCPNCHAQTETYCGKNKGNYSAPT